MSEPANQNDEQKRCILVVEDEYFLAIELRNVLRDSGFLVLGPASSVDHALDLLRERRPDAAVLDVNLGKEKVTPVALHLKALGVPYLLTSASDAAELARSPAFEGIVCIEKPTDAALLVRALQDLTT